MTQHAGSLFAGTVLCIRLTMTRRSMSLYAVVILSILAFDPHTCGAVVCEGTVNDDCNGLKGTCTDTGLCEVGPDGVTCGSNPDNDICGDIGITSVESSKSMVVNSTERSDIPTSNPVEYECEFINRWTAATHPSDYPSNAHWSRMVIASHSNGYQMWAPDVEATDGVQSVAETGSVAILTDELDAAGSDIGSTSSG